MERLKYDAKEDNKCLYADTEKIQHRKGPDSGEHVLHFCFLLHLTQSGKGLVHNLRMIRWGRCINKNE